MSTLENIEYDKAIEYINTSYKTDSEQLPIKYTINEAADFVHNQSVVICCCVYNCGRYLDTSIANVYRLARMFKEYKILVFENDSTDTSRNKLIEYANRDNNFILVSIKGLFKAIPLRTHRLAHCRNTLLRMAMNMYYMYDYYVVADMDNVFSKLNENDVLSCFRYDPNKWDMMSATGSKEYYDIWALRGYRTNYDFIDYVNHLMQHPYNKHKRGYLYTSTVNVHQAKITETEPIQVYSAFCGLAIYKMSSIKDCYYDGIPKWCTFYNSTVKTCCHKEVCEHVYFHYQMIRKNNAKLYINPQLQIR